MGHLTTKERYTIEKLKAMDYSTRAIAATLGRSRTTISREIQRFEKRRKYRSAEAARAAKKLRRPSANGYRIPEPVKQTVRLLLKKKLSPEQITGSLRLRYKGKGSGRSWPALSESTASCGKTRMREGFSTRTCDVKKAKKEVWNKSQRSTRGHARQA